MLAWPKKAHISSCFCLISRPGLLYTSPYRWVLHTHYLGQNELPVRQPAWVHNLNHGYTTSGAVDFHESQCGGLRQVYILHERVVLHCQKCSGRIVLPFKWVSVHNAEQKQGIGELYTVLCHTKYAAKRLGAPKTG